MTLLSVNNIQKTYQKAHKKAVSESGPILAKLNEAG